MSLVLATLSRFKILILALQFKLFFHLRHTYYTALILQWQDIRDKYTFAQRNNYDSRQEQIETLTPNEEYENFVYTHLEAAAEFIPFKQRRKYRVPWETLAVREKRTDVIAASKCNRKNPTNTNALKLKKAQNELDNIYLNEQREYFQNQIYKIRDSVEDRQSRITWQTMNEMSNRKGTAKAKQKATSQQD